MPPIANDAADGLVAPKHAYDYREHSIVSSLIDLYGDDLPRTLKLARGSLAGAACLGASQKSAGILAKAVTKTRTKEPR
jgi:hypothetical protein